MVERAAGRCGEATKWSGAGGGRRGKPAVVSFLTLVPVAEEVSRDGQGEGPSGRSPQQGDVLREWWGGGTGALEEAACWESTRGRQDEVTLTESPPVTSWCLS